MRFSARLGALGLTFEGSLRLHFCAFLLVLSITDAIALSNVFSIVFSCFFNRQRHGFAIALLIVFGDREEMSNFAKPLQNTGHAQKNRRWA